MLQRVEKTFSTRLPSKAPPVSAGPCWVHAGRIILDISGQEKKDLTVPELLEMFARASGDEFSGDRAILA